MTLHLVIVCLTVLAALALIARALLERDQRRAQLQREVAMHERQVAKPFADLAGAVEALTAAAGTLEAAAGQPGPSLLGHRVTVHTKKPEEHTLFGLVVGDYTDRLVLEDAEYVTPGGARSLPGRPTVPTAEIAWYDDHGNVRVPNAAPASARESPMVGTP